MENIVTALVVFSGIILRIGIPVGITAILVYLFSRLDANWKAEAEKTRRAEVKRLLSIDDSSRCWNIKGCPEKTREKCPAYAEKDSRCWQTFRNRDGMLKERCLNCEVFIRAPVPLSG
jgi:hypothetical protein